MAPRDFVDEQGKSHPLRVKRTRFKVSQDLVGVRRRTARFSVGDIAHGTLEELEVDPTLTQRDFIYIMDAESGVEASIAVSLGEIFGEQAPAIAAAYGHIVLAYYVDCAPEVAPSDKGRIGEHVLKELIGNFGLAFAEQPSHFFNAASGFERVPGAEKLMWKSGNPLEPPLPKRVGVKHVARRDPPHPFGNVSEEDYCLEDGVAEALSQVKEGDSADEYVWELRELLARRLRLLRADYGELSLGDLSERAGVSKRAVETLFNEQPSKGLDDTLRVLWALETLPDEVFSQRNFYEPEEDWRRPPSGRARDHDYDDDDYDGGDDDGPFGPDTESLAEAYVADRLADILHTDPRASGAAAARALMASVSEDSPISGVHAIRRALELDPGCIEALERLWDFQAGSDHEEWLARRLVAAHGARLSAEELVGWEVLSERQKAYLNAKTELAAVLIRSSPVEAAMHAREVAERDPQSTGGVYFALATLRAGLFDEWKVASARYLGGDGVMHCYLRSLGSFVLDGPEPATPSMVETIKRSPEAARAIAGVSMGADALLNPRALSRVEFEAMNAGIWLSEAFAETPGAIRWLKKCANEAGVLVADLRGTL